MKDEKRQDKPDGFYTRDLPAIACLASVILLVVHLGSDSIKVDAPALGLLGFAIGIWFLPVIKKIKLGDTEIELWDRLQKVEEEQRKVVDALSDPRDAGLIVRGFAATPRTGLEARDAALLNTLRGPDNPLRSARSAVAEAGLPMDEREAFSRLTQLAAAGLVNRLHGSNGPVWGLTPEGRAALQPLDENSR